MFGRMMLVAWGMVAVSGCATERAGAPEGAVTIIAHRGASAYAPENTLVAFEKAVELGADWFELDCTLSKDLAIIVIHDDTLKRTTGEKGAVRDLTLETIKKADAGSWFDESFAGEAVPTLGEALDLAKGRIGVYVEIKDSGNDGTLREALLKLGDETGAFLPDHRSDLMARIEEDGTRNLELTLRVIHAIKTRKMEKEAVIQSFSPIVCAIALAEAPDIRTELLASSNDDKPTQWEDFLRWLELLEPAGFNISRGDVTPELLADIHDRGMTMAVWTVNSESDMKRFADMGVDALITNKPDVALRAMGR